MANGPVPYALYPPDDHGFSEDGLLPHRVRSNLPAHCLLGLAREATFIHLVNGSCMSTNLGWEDGTTPPCCQAIPLCCHEHDSGCDTPEDSRNCGPLFKDIGAANEWTANIVADSRQHLILLACTKCAVTAVKKSKVSSHFKVISTRKSAPGRRPYREYTARVHRGWTRHQRGDAGTPVRNAAIASFQPQFI